jgi:uncharacterized protein with HEPN domain
MSEVDFRNQELIVDAVERCLMRISEAAVKLGADAERLCADQPWADIRGLGNKLRHFYHEVDADIVWNLVAGGKLDQLKAACLTAIEQLEAQG